MGTPSNKEWLIKPVEKDAEDKPYRELIGSLIYISITRIDIKFAVSKLAGFMNDWNLLQWNTAVRLVKYLYHTRFSGVVITTPGNSGISAETDASWGDSPNNRSSTLGYIIRWGNNVIEAYSKSD